jgi:transposase
LQQGKWTVIIIVLKGEIRVRHQREGKSISQIAMRTSLSSNTIKKWLKAPAEAAPKCLPEQAPGMLAPFVATLTQ